MAWGGLDDGWVEERVGEQPTPPIESVQNSLRGSLLLADLEVHLAGDTPDRAPLRAELGLVEGALRDLAEQWARGDLLDVEHRSARAVHVERHADLTAALHRIGPVRAALTIDQIRDAWGHADNEDRRSVAAALLATVAVGRAHAEGRRVPLDQRVTITPMWAATDLGL